MSECIKCNGTGMVPCSKCGGVHAVTECPECKGKGVRKCTYGDCNGTGKIECFHCGGTGIENCSVCNGLGSVQKYNWINCRRCHGTGIIGYRSSGHSCETCGGRGQVKDYYMEICPNCHGTKKDPDKRPCRECKGAKRVTCNWCDGTGHVKCSNCDGGGKINCTECHGTGKEKCPDCAAREKRKEEQKRTVEAKRRQENRLRQEAEQRAKERKDAMRGCGCLLALAAIVGFLIWWWMEGFTMAGLSNIGSQVKSACGGQTGLWNLAKIGGVLIVLGIIWRLIKGKKNEKSTSTKKRWKFVVLGLLLGFIGVHFAYAKRWFLFLLLWASFITGGIASDKNAEAEKLSIDTTGVQVEQQAEAKSKNSGSMVENIGFATWLLLWIGGALFIKKDGRGNRM